MPGGPPEGDKEKDENGKEVKHILLLFEAIVLNWD